MKKLNRKGFTLAELLIVVAIIAVLVAIAIPVFAAQLEKSREATDMANVRSAYATLVAQYLENNQANSITVPGSGQDTSSWLDTAKGGKLEAMANGAISEVTFNPGSSYVVSIDGSGNISVTAS